MSIPKIFVRSAYNYDREAASDESGLSCPELGRTVQSDAAQADINEIVRRFGLTGRLPENVRVPTFADFEDVVDFQSAQNAIVAARESFMAMPAEVRGRFDNDAGRFVEFCSDKSNLDEMRALGLAVPASRDGSPAVSPPVL
ncbi:MAG: internal scaffolding protein [Microvirus sp.]|nr:MAG: internal scaffolding protein [Microvirus sp.]